MQRTRAAALLRGVSPSAQQRSPTRNRQQTRHTIVPASLAGAARWRRERFTNIRAGNATMLRGILILALALGVRGDPASAAPEGCSSFSVSGAKYEPEEFDVITWLLNGGYDSGTPDWDVDGNRFRGTSSHLDGTYTLKKACDDGSGSFEYECEPCNKLPYEGWGFYMYKTDEMWYVGMYGCNHGAMGEEKGASQEETP